MNFICLKINNHIHINGFALSLFGTEALGNSEMAYLKITGAKTRQTGKELP